MTRFKDNVVEFKRPAINRLLGASPDKLLAIDEISLGAEIADPKKRQVTMCDDARTRHTMLVGATGTGKSTLIMNMISQIIEHKKNESLVLMDPHGELYAMATERFARIEHMDVTRIDFSDRHSTFRFNPLAHAAEDEWYVKSKIPNDFVELFNHMYDMRLCGGPIFELYLREALLLLLGDKETRTLDDFSRVFSSEEFRTLLISRSAQTSSKRFWINAEKRTGEDSLVNIAAYITSKLNSFTSNPLISSILNAKSSSFHFPQVFQKPTVVVINLHKGILGQTNIQLLGTMLLNHLNCRAMIGHYRRENTTRCNIVLDEAHNFLTPSIVQMFPEARKFGINMVIANQNLAQIDQRNSDSLLETLLANVGNIIAFRLGSRDSFLLSDYFQPVMSCVDLQNQPNFQAVTRLLKAEGVKPPSLVSINRHHVI